MKRWTIAALSVSAALVVGVGLAAANTASDGPIAESPSANHNPTHAGGCEPCEGVRLMNAGDFADAMRIFQHAAAEGDSGAINNIGWMYEHGLGRPIDGKEALKWYDRAASLGNATAAENAGRLYQNGEGVPVDYAKAMDRYQFAASQSDPRALNHIGYMYQHGLGVPESPWIAYAWYRMAARAGSDQAPAHIKELLDWGVLTKRPVRSPAPEAAYHAP
jgi:hypothetical protein